ncbi:MAG: hypothetical protein Q9213_002647 [Squamulea squamosa]
MAESELSACPSSVQVDESDGHYGMNVDEILEATIDEAANDEEASDEGLQEHLIARDLEDIPAGIIRRISVRMNFSMKCVQCHKEGVVEDLCVCPGCRGRTYHKTCWPQASFHLSPESCTIVCKEPISFKEYVWISHLLRPQTEPQEQAGLHKADMWSSWFNVPNQQDRPMLYVYARLQWLINNAQALRDDSKAFEQYPSLVSFFGETGGGVHLYCDPKTIDTNVPLLYAGRFKPRFSSGSNVWIQTVKAFGVAWSQQRPTSLKKTPPQLRPDKVMTTTMREFVPTLGCRGQWQIIGPLLFVECHCSGRPAVLVKQPGEQRLSTHGHDFRATENELCHLFQWASIGHERTVNQRIRPGLLIIINKDAPDSDERWYDVDYATSELMRHLELSTRFEDLKEEWRLRGRPISTAKDLILCYYDSFRIICIPSLTPETAHDIALQYSKLYNEIRGISERLRKKKLQVHMNLNVRSFCNYVEHVFNRLAKDMSSSVDFHYLASKNLAGPTKFRDHVVALIIKLKEDEENVDPPYDVQEAKLVDRVIPFLACCIASQCAKNDTRSDAKIESYLRECRQGLEKFRETSWRCEKTSDQARCCNYWVGHDKGHQFSWRRIDASGGNSSLLTGEFLCTWEPEKLIRKFGGVRRILELLILQEVPDEVGLGLPIQELFDLAIGTSTGGIIALGLFKMGWSVKRAISEFERLSRQAFSKNDYAGIPVFRHSTQLLYSHRYKGKSLDNALQSAFGQRLLFGSNKSTNSEKVKVGVLAAVPGGRRPYLFTNYSRDSGGQGSDYLVREDDLEDELMCWEAARSTSAAPTYFPPYYHKAKGQHYVDGALLRNNPIQILEEERRVIWRDKTPPDILLSVGTGIQVGADGAAKSAGRGQRMSMKLLPKGIRGRLAVGHDVIQSTLDCNRQWDEFVKSMKWDRDTHRVCHRLNIGFMERPPVLDDVNSIPYLKATAMKYLNPGQSEVPYLNKRYRSGHKHILAVAQRLTAALFYFELIAAKSDDEKCVGIIHCRLGSAMRDNFKSFLSEGPTFRVRQRIRGDSWSNWTQSE